MSSDPTFGTTAPPPLPPPTFVASTSTLAVVSLVAGITSWLLLPFVAGLVAIVCGHMARGEIARSGGRLEGDGLAVTGLVLGWVNVIMSVLAIAAVVLFLGGLAFVLGMLGISGHL